MSLLLDLTVSNNERETFTQEMTKTAYKCPYRSPSSGFLYMIAYMEPQAIHSPLKTLSVRVLTAMRTMLSEWLKNLIASV